MNEKEIIREKVSIFGSVLGLLSLGVLLCLIAMACYETSMFLCIFFFLLAMVLAVLVVILCLGSDGFIMVTNMRVCGTTVFGRKLDLPLDFISAVGVQSLFKEVSISTSSGMIRFKFIKNYDQVYNVISQLLYQRQNIKNSMNQSNNMNQIKNNDKKDELDDLKKLKELLDSGVITRKEFEAKKKKILDL